MLRWSTQVAPAPDEAPARVAGKADVS
jgi:hypothetical protein